MAKLAFDIRTIEKISDLMRDRELSEVKIEEGDYSICLRRGPKYAAPAAAPVAAAPMAAHAPAAAPAVEAAPAASEAEHPGAVKSPMVGTAYLASQPGAAPFASVGDKVKTGQALLIIEAMKVMNQITADRAGTVVKVLVTDGEPVEFGQPLLIIE